jgi:hypothetical protein
MSERLFRNLPRVGRHLACQSLKLDLKPWTVSSRRMRRRSISIAMLDSGALGRPARGNVIWISAHGLGTGQYLQCPGAQRNAVIAARLHTFAWYRPDGFIRVNF